jgi:hypothetical protein
MPSMRLVLRVHTQMKCPVRSLKTSGVRRRQDARAGYFWRGASKIDLRKDTEEQRQEFAS